MLARIGSSFPGGGARSPVRTDRHFTVDGENILVWNLATDEWYDVACRAAGRNMTRAEWDEFGPRDADYQATCAQFAIEPKTAPWRCCGFKPSLGVSLVYVSHQHRHR